MSNINYQPTTEAGMIVKSVKEDVNSAHFQWNLFAGYVSRGYVTAYARHTKALGDVKQSVKDSNDFSHFLLSLVCVSLGGGIIGGAMAPWIAKAGSDVFQNVVRTGLGGVTGSGIQMAVQGGLDAVKSETTSPFDPEAIDPFSKYLDLTNGIGLLFSMIREFVSTMAKVTDEGKMSIESGKTAKNMILGWPLIAKAPGTNDMPSPAAVADQTELGMWIAWAHKRDIAYWTKRVKGVTDGQYTRGVDEYYKAELLQLGPIANRLSELGATRALSKVYFGAQGINNPSVGYGHGQEFVDIPKLKQLGGVRGGVFYENLHAMMNPTTAINALESLNKVPPSFARKKGYYDAY